MKEERCLIKERYCSNIGTFGDEGGWHERTRHRPGEGVGRTHCMRGLDIRARDFVFIEST